MAHQVGLTTTQNIGNGNGPPGGTFDHNGKIIMSHEMGQTTGKG